MGAGTMSQCHNVTGKWVANLQTVKQTILTFIHVKLQVLPLTPPPNTGTPRLTLR